MQSIGKCLSKLLLADITLTWSCVIERAVITWNTRDEIFRREDSKGLKLIGIHGSMKFSYYEIFMFGIVEMSGELRAEKELKVTAEIPVWLLILHSLA